MEDVLGLSDVLAKIRRADESLTEFIAPWWPGVTLAAAWLEGKSRLFTVMDFPATAGYYLLRTEQQTAQVIRQAEAEEIHRYLSYLAKASVILLEDELAFPASFAERLLGITGPRPIHFTAGSALTPVQARFDGINLFFEGGKSARESSPLEQLFANSSIFSPGELLGVPGASTAGSEAEDALQTLRAQPEEVTRLHLVAVLESAGAILEEWTRSDGALRVRWRRLEEEHLVMLPSAASPITSGVSLAGARGFELASLTRLLLDHALDAWR